MNLRSPEPGQTPKPTKARLTFPTYLRRARLASFPLSTLASLLASGCAAGGGHQVATSQPGDVQQNQGAIVAPITAKSEIVGNTGISYVEAAIGGGSLAMITVVLGFASLVHKRDKDTGDKMVKALHDSVPNDIATGLLTLSNRADQSRFCIGENGSGNAGKDK